MGDLTAIVALAQNTHLLKLIEKEFPTIKYLLEDCPEGTLRFLSEQSAINALKGEVRIEVGHAGNDSKKAWNDYFGAIKKWLDDRDGTKCLGIARTQVATYIHRTHYNKFPAWPSVNDRSQESYIVLNTQIAYVTEKNVKVMCSVEGDATVRDDRVSESSYYAYVKGNPIFKVLWIDNDRMMEVEDLVKTDRAKALGKMRERKRQAIGVLTFADL